MGDYATYRAVRAEMLAAALGAEEPGAALGMLASGDRAEGLLLDLTNAYEALVYVLAGPDGDREDFDDPLVAAVLGHDEVAYDSPTVNDVQWTAQIERALSGFDRTLIADRFDPEEMDDDGVEPGGFAADPGWLDTVQESFDQLQSFYRSAADNGMAVLVVIG
ncbi:Domain of uncharacterised function (DUF1877) [Mycolicibacterium aurum]|uniref:Domain of uncharacterized function (DUF1877) n=1 Tax=Mycolicibacterium aurum TaxID=1791 RepID=A0A448II20_MYCAU|nr:DUF1877 family protein [Mycolicibacterium aurum]VEG52132.1 Domain of uncharacterised function (DUF1877) [Mycolicibacterium aurum]